MSDVRNASRAPTQDRSPDDPPDRSQDAAPDDAQRGQRDSSHAPPHAPSQDAAHAPAHDASHDASHRRARRPVVFLDQIAVAAEAVACGSAHDGHWATLAAFAEHEGLDRVAEMLVELQGSPRPTRLWWRHTLVLCGSCSSEQAVQATEALIAVEANGGGPSFEVDRHALRVSSALRFLQDHLARVLTGDASNEECAAACQAIDTVRLARARLGR